VQAAKRPAVAPGGRHGWLARFPPGHFAFVMATGIVSLAAHFQELPLAPPRCLRLT
jgi:hypothetical protein